MPAENVRAPFNFISFLYTYTSNNWSVHWYICLSCEQVAFAVLRSSISSAPFHRTNGLVFIIVRTNDGRSSSVCTWKERSWLLSGISKSRTVKPCPWILSNAWNVRERFLRVCESSDTVLSSPSIKYRTLWGSQSLLRYCPSNFGERTIDPWRLSSSFYLLSRELRTRDSKLRTCILYVRNTSRYRLVHRETMFPFLSVPRLARKSLDSSEQPLLWTSDSVIVIVLLSFTELSSLYLLTRYDLARSLRTTRFERSIKTRDNKEKRMAKSGWDEEEENGNGEEDVWYGLSRPWRKSCGTAECGGSPSSTTGNIGIQACRIDTVRSSVILPPRRFLWSLKFIFTNACNTYPYLTLVSSTHFSRERRLDNVVQPLRARSLVFTNHSDDHFGSKGEENDTNCVGLFSSDRRLVNCKRYRLDNVDSWRT